MYCNNCGKQIEEDSIFCQFCGNKVAEDAVPHEIDDSSETENTKLKTVSKSKIDVLWDKFAEVYDARDGEKEKFNSLSSEHIWDLIDRLSTNAFETFIEEHKDDLNTQPYKVIESLKSHYVLAVIGGYRLWIAESLLKEVKLNKFKSFTLDNFVEEWKNSDFNKLMKDVSDEMGTCMTMFLDHRMNSFFDNNPSIKDVTNATIKNLKESITFQILNGYLAGVIETKFRK